MPWSADFCISLANPSASLQVSVLLLLEPVIGSFLGYFFHQSTLPGLFTFLGGPVIIAGCVWVTVSAYKRSLPSTATAKDQSSQPIEDRAALINTSEERQNAAIEMVEVTHTIDSKKGNKLSDEDET